VTDSHMPTYNNDKFSLDYEGSEMKRALYDGEDLRDILSSIVSRNDIDAMNSISNKIFKLIMDLDTELQNYELSIALTNYYFEKIWKICEDDLREGKNKIAEDKIKWSCKIVWNQEKSLAYTFHKGTPYYFLGYCYLISGNLDLAFQMIHNGHTENLVTYPRLGLDYRTAPSYLFMTLNANDSRNYMYEIVLVMKEKVEYFIKEHNEVSCNNMTYATFDKNFLQLTDKNFDNVKFYFVYLIMSLINMNLPEESSLHNNDFSNIRKIELMFDLGLIVDKTLAQKYGTPLIRQGVIKYLNQVLSIAESTYDKIINNLSYTNGDPFKISADPKIVANALLNNTVLYKKNPISYSFRCMLLSWNLRNFSAHNLSGIDVVLKNSFSHLLTMLFSALFFASEIL
jgi:hypothetical protein